MLRWYHRAVLRYYFWCCFPHPIMQKSLREWCKGKKHWLWSANSCRLGPKSKAFAIQTIWVCKGGGKHSSTRIAHRTITSGDSKMRHGHTRRGSRNKIPRASCLTLNSLRGTHRCHLFHVITDMRSATSLERAPKPWLSTVTICHSGQSPSSGIILMGQR